MVFLCLYLGFPGGSVVKNLPATSAATVDVSLIPGLGRYPGKGNGNPLQHSCLENPTDREAWWATVHRVAQNQTRLKRLSSSSSSSKFRKAQRREKKSWFFNLTSWTTASLVAQQYRIHLPMQETLVWSLGGEHPLEKEMATHSSIFVWKIPWTAEPSGLQFMGLQ